jgi:hypothetical protein
VNPTVGSRRTGNREFWKFFTQNPAALGKSRNKRAFPDFLVFWGLRKTLKIKKLENTERRDCAKSACIRNSLDFYARNFTHI